MPIFILIFFVLLIIYAVLIDYYRRAWNKIPVPVLPPVSGKTIVSVIIAARNEAKNIPTLLRFLHSQSYPKDLFEVIVVDDHSTDDTYSLLQESGLPGLQLKALRLEEHLPEGAILKSTKKKAIETGIAAAKGSLIVCTDADCVAETEWLQTMVAFYERNDATFIAAPVTFFHHPTLLAIFQQLDFLTLQGITGASVFKKIHSMCNGANLAYEKAAFYEVGGFEGIDHLASGDDMLLMHKISLRYPEKVFYLKNKSAIVTTKAMENWKEFLHQRIRWSSKATHYQDKRIFGVLLLVYILNVSYLALGVAAIWNVSWVVLWLLFFLAKLLIEFPFVNTVSVFFGRQELMKYFLVMQPLHIIYTIIAGWLGKVGSFEWKGRKVRTR